MSLGNRGGRPPKDTSLHIAHGTHRKDRHGSRSSGALVEGVVVRPAMPADAESFWDSVVQPMVDRGLVTAGDGPSAQAMCESWYLMRRTFAALDNDPTDKPTRTAYIAYSQMFDKIAARFGLTPADRQRLKFEKPPEKSPFQKFLEKKPG